MAVRGAANAVNSCVVCVFWCSVGSGRTARGGSHAQFARQCARGIAFGTGCKFGRPASAYAAVSVTIVHFYALACGRCRAAAEAVSECV